MEAVGWFVVALVASAVILAATEGLLRIMAGRLHPVTEWHSWEIHHRVAALDRLSDSGGASVVAVGSSMVNAAFDPDLMSELHLFERPAFNAGLNGAGVRLLELWMLGIVLPRLRPDVVVIGLGSHEVSSGNTIARRLHQSLVTSPAWRDLQSDRTVWERLVRWGEKTSFLIRYRRYLGRRRLLRDNPVRRSTTCRALGKPRALLLFRFREYRIDDRQLEIWNQLLNDFDVGQQEMAALDRLVTGIQDSGAVPVLMRMPVTQAWIDMHPRGKDDFVRFEDALVSFARERNISYVDLSSSFSSLEGFADPIHLNGLGLRRFTEILSDRLKSIVAPSRA